MTKFKVGDRVVVVKDLVTDSKGYYVGKRGVIQRINPDKELTIRVWVDGEKDKQTGFMEDELELLDDNL